MERAVHHHLMKYLENNDLLFEYQFGYRTNRSTELVTTLFVDNVRKYGNNGLLTGAVFLDLSKAFETVDYALPTSGNQG